jgi:hypothetical protein
MTFAGNKAIIDQQQLYSTTTVSISDVQECAQIFEPGMDGHMTGVALLLSKTLGMTADGQPISPGNLIVEIMTLADDLVPSGLVIASATINEDFIASEIPGWYQVIFNDPPLFSKKSRYAIVVHTEGGGTASDTSKPFYSLFSNASSMVDAYPAGMLAAKDPLRSYRDWYSWWDGKDYDAAFVTYMMHGKN